MLSWLKREKKVPGWFALSVDANEVEFAHGQYAPSGKARITVYGTQTIDADKNDLSKIANTLRLARYGCSALLRPGDYQLLLVEAPNVPKEELRSAIRWRIKDMIDYHVDDATVDVLDIPSQGAATRAHLMYAVAARNDLIQSMIHRCEEARIPLSVIDIEETAQRNIAALYETQERAVALVYFAEQAGLLTINYGGEIYLARRFEIGLQQLRGEAGAVPTDTLERLAVEIQRTLDHFDRSFRSIPVAKLLVAPTPSDTGAGAFLKARLGIECDDIDLRDVLAFQAPAPEKEAQWRLFHHFGAALRHEAKAL